MNKMILRDKIALITGGSRGIGKAIAAAFLSEGAKVMLAARDQTELEDTQKEFRSKFSGVEIFSGDVTDEDDNKRLVEETLKAFGRIDVLVNGAGIYGPIGPSESVDFRLWKQTYEINVFGTFSMIQHAVPSMKQAGKGKIINFSGGGDGPLPRFSAYHSSKGAIVRLTETLGEEFKEYRIDVNAIAPGPVNTKFLDEAIAAGREQVGDARYEALLKQKQEGGVPPERAAEICVFLASAASDGLTGRFLSAVWDDWKHWDKEKILAIMQTDAYTFRRVKGK
jgi:3-oxoacyl-[acyl-carrier protein] reductase